MQQGEAELHDSVDLKQYLAIMRGRRWTILVVSLLVLGSALFFSYQQTPLYRATARLLVKGVPTDSSGFVQLPNLPTEAELVRSQPVASRVVEDLGLETLTGSLLEDLEVQPIAEAGYVLELTYTSPDRETARDVPNSFATNYIDYKRQQAEEALDEGVEAIQSQIEAVQNRLSDLTDRLNDPGVTRDGALTAALENERSATTARLGVVQQRLDDFQTSRPLDLAGGDLIEPAALPNSPASPDHVKNALLAGLLGLALGIGAALLRERLDERIRGREDLERTVGLPVLGTVPKFPSSSKKGTEIVTISQPRGSASESYRTLRTNLQFLSVQSQLRSILVTSPSAGEGKTATCVNLGVAFAQAGRRVILLSADLRRPTLETYFGIRNTEGLTTWLMASDRELWGLIRDPGIDNLRVIPSGPVPPNPAELLTSPRLNELIDLLENNADLVLVDSPPALAVADAAILATHVDGTLVVVDAAETHRSAAARATQELQRVGAGLLGTVLNAFDPAGSTYYYQHYYHSEYSSQALPTEGHLAGAGAKRRRSRLGFRR